MKNIGAIKYFIHDFKNKSINYFIVKYYLTYYIINYFQDKRFICKIESKINYLF